jgi:hypothetical protein
MSKEELFEQAAGDLAGELATMHGTLYNLILALRNTKLSPPQRVLLEAANCELRHSQDRFFAKYADEVGGSFPENN